MSFVLRARPDGNLLQQWKWQHRYFLWTWSICGALICAIRDRWDLASNVGSYILAIPAAIAVGAIAALVLSLYYRVRSRFPLLPRSN
jgi:hypothetical protein